MPSRVVRGSINSSESLAARSIGAEHFFMKLLLAVDDYGRTDARPRYLRSLLWPLRDDPPPAPEIAAWLVELSTIAEGDDPPIEVYEVDGKPYLRFVNWEVHRGKQKRGQVSRWPDPTGESPRGSADILGAPRIPDRGVEVSGCRGVGVISTEPPAQEKSARRAAVLATLEMEWLRAIETFSAYGRTFKPGIGLTRQARLVSILAEHQGPDRTQPHVDAIHGWVYGNRDRPLEWLVRYCQPETVWKVSGVQRNLDQYDHAIAAGLVPPFIAKADEEQPRKVTTKVSRIAQRLREKEEQDANRIEAGNGPAHPQLEGR